MASEAQGDQTINVGRDASNFLNTTTNTTTNNTTINNTTNNHNYPALPLIIETSRPWGQPSVGFASARPNAESGLLRGDLRGVPPLPDSYIERPAAFAALQPNILDGNGTAASKRIHGTHGMGGVGKTTVAISIARDPDVCWFVKGCIKKVIRNRT